MTKIQIIIYISFLCLELFGIALFMEIYKKQVRKNNSSKIENRIIGLILSIIGVGILLALHIFKPVLGLIGAAPWADYVLYVGLFYFFQKTTDMRIVKNLIKTCQKNLLIKYGFSEKQIDDIFKASK